MFHIINLRLGLCETEQAIFLSNIFKLLYVVKYLNLELKFN